MDNTTYDDKTSMDDTDIDTTPVNLVLTIITIMFFILLLVVILLCIQCCFSICYECFCHRRNQQDIEMVSINVSDYTVPIENDDGKCVICIDELEMKETCKMINCNHVFHKECIQDWLNVKHNCPICRTSIHQNREEVILIV